MKKIISIITVLVLGILLAIPVWAEGELVVDNADILTDSEEQQLTEILQQVSDDNDASIVVVTTDSVDGKSWQLYAADYFDYNGYGTDGVILLISMEEGNRGISIVTTGNGYDCFYDSDVENAYDVIQPYCADGDFYGACEAYAEFVDNQYKNGAGASGGASSGSSGPNWIFIAIVAVVVGVVVSLIICTSMKKKHNTVRLKAEAENYMVPGSLSITRESDKFMYMNVTKVPIQHDNNNNHSSFTGSSGMSHGGGGGRSF